MPITHSSVKEKDVKGLTLPQSLTFDLKLEN